MIHMSRPLAQKGPSVTASASGTLRSSIRFAAHEDLLMEPIGLQDLEGQTSPHVMPPSGWILNALNSSAVLTGVDLWHSKY